MKENYEKLIIDFKRKGWQTPNLYERVFELTSNPESVFKFCESFLKGFEKGATIFNDSLSYIEKEQFAELIALALDILKQKANENAAEVIEYASLQFPELLHEHIELLFELRPNESAYYSDYPWRNLPIDKIDSFKDRFENPQTSLSDKQKLFNCLLETRNLDVIESAFQFAKNTNLFDKEDIENYLTYYLESVGYTLKDGKIVSYCPNPVFHICFPDKYFTNDGPVYLSKKQHPTWNLKPAEEQYEFGGIIKEDENNPFIHIITLNPIPEYLKISHLTNLTLGMHIRELNEYESVFYKHDEFGMPNKIGETKEIEFYNDLPIQKTNVSFAKSPQRWGYQSWGSSNSRENLFRLGGEPTWIQGADVLTCPICNEKMDFLMQLDSELPNTENDEVYFGSGGICYIFWCDKSKVSGYIMQCT